MRVSITWWTLQTFCTRCFSLQNRVVFKENSMPKILSAKTRWNCVQTDISKCKIKNEKDRSKNRADWDKFVSVATVRIGL
jgi:hypothetical protein